MTGAMAAAEAGAGDVAGRAAGAGDVAGRAAAVVLAAGGGSRMGAATNKVFLAIDGKSILGRTLELFEGLSIISSIVLVIAESDRAACAAVVREGGYEKVDQVVVGGDSRHASEFIGLLALEHDAAAGTIDVALVHDAVRPFVAADEIGAVAAAARRTGAAILAMPAGGQMMAVAGDGAVVAADPDLWIAQTPQAFAVSVALEAHRRAAEDGFVGTDTSAVVERTGQPVSVVEGQPDNIKITTSEDLIRAELIARRLRESNGGRRPSHLTPRI